MIRNKKEIYMICNKDPEKLSFYKYTKRVVRKKSRHIHPYYLNVIHLLQNIPTFSRLYA